MWDGLIEILMIILLLTGGLFWVGFIFAAWFYWMCKRPPKEEKNV